MLDALEAASDADPAVLTHHALGAGDVDRIRRAASDAGAAAARSGAHTQAAEFFTDRARQGGPLTGRGRSGAARAARRECYLIDRLDDAIAACQRAMRIRQELGESAAVSANHHSLSVYQWYNANRELAEGHAAEAVAVLDAESGDAAQLVAARSRVRDAGLPRAAGERSRPRGKALIGRAREIADRQAIPR